MDGSLSSIQMRLQSSDIFANTQRLRIGQQPHYIHPKHKQHTTSEPEILSESQFNSSMAVPKFHNPSIGESIIFSKRRQNDKKDELCEEVSELRIQGQSEVGTLLVGVSAIVWFCYFVGSFQITNQKYTGFHIVDLVGNGLALLLLGFSVYAKKSINSFSQILHIWSIILTLTFIIYPSNLQNQSDKSLIEAISILRSFRLIFPLFIDNSITSLARDFIKIVLKSKKIILFATVLCFLLGLFFYQVFADSIGNRCRANEFPVVLDTWDPLDQRLCGVRTCQSGAYCKNPKQYGFQISQNQGKMQIHGNGLFAFDSSWTSAVSVFQIFTLNAWGKISNTYFDAFPGWVIVPFFILGFIVFEKLFMSLYVIFFDMKKLKREQIHMLTGSQRKQQKNTKDHQNVDHIKIEEHDVQISKIVSSRMFISQKSTGKVTFEQNPQRMSKKLKTFLYIMLITFSMAHFILSSQFALHPTRIQEDLYNRKVGISLCIFFILQLVAVCLIKFQLLTSDQQQDQSPIESSNHLLNNHEYGLSEKKTINVMMTLEGWILLVLAMDYLLRIIEGKFILQQASCVTALGHFLIAVRMGYVFVVMGDLIGIRCLKSHLVAVIKTMTATLKYVFAVIILSVFLGVMSFNIKHQTSSQSSQKPISLFLQSNRFLTLIINHSWQNLWKQSFGQKIQTESLFVEIVGTVCLIVGSMIFVKYLISNAVHEAFWEGMKGSQQTADKYIQEKRSKKSIKSSKQHQSIKTYKQFTKQTQDNAQTTALKKQKSLLIFSYDNCIRQLFLSIIKEDYYQEVIRFRFFILYVALNVIGCCAFSFKAYYIMSIVLECLILVDAVMGIIALRVFGEFSYTENKIMAVLHVLSAFVVIVLSMLEFQTQFVPVMQACRVLVVLNYFQSFKMTFEFIETLWKPVVLHFLIMIPIILGFTLILLLTLSAKQADVPFIKKIVQSFKLSLVLMCQKGWDIKHFFGYGNEMTLFSQVTLFIMLSLWLCFALPLFYTLAGIFLSTMVKTKKQQEEELKKQLGDSVTLLQEQKIRQRISQIKPKFDYNLYNSGILLKLCTSAMFQTCQKLSCLGSILCFLILNTTLSTNQRIALYSCHLFFFSSQLLLFICTSMGHNRNQQHYLRDLLLNIMAIPGAYIGFVNPVQYSSQSYDLKVILMIFNALTIVRFVKVVNYFHVFERVYGFMRNKMTQTLNVLAIVAVAAVTIGFYIFVVLGRKESIVECVNHAFVGLVGGDFYGVMENLFQRNQITLTYQAHLLYLTVHFLNIVLVNLFVAFVIYELSDYVNESMPLTNTEFSLYNFTKYFHQDQFLNQWQKLDPQGKGFANYRSILHKSHMFMRHFSITTIPYKGYLNRIQTFRRLQVPIYQAQTQIQQQNSQKPTIKKQYVITFYDFLWSLSRFAFKQMTSTKLISKQNYFIKNITFNDQPISIINIQNTNHLSNFSKRNDNQQKLVDEINNNWKQQCLKVTKQCMDEKIEEHPQIQGIESVLRPTKINSQELYYAYRVKGKVYRFLKQTQTANQLKRHQQVQGFRMKKLTI